MRDETRISPATLLGVGCLTALAGAFGGGMIMVLVAKVVGSIRGCDPGDGLPACDWNSYAAIGFIAGLILLPTISIVRLKSRRV